MNGIVYKLEQAQDGGGGNLHFFTIKQGLRIMLFRGLRTHTKKTKSSMVFPDK